MNLLRVRLVNLNGNSYFDCWMPPGHVGAWMAAMAEHGALARYVEPHSGYRLEVTTVDWS